MKKLQIIITRLRSLTSGSCFHPKHLDKHKSCSYHPTPNCTGTKLAMDSSWLPINKNRTQEETSGEFSLFCHKVVFILAFHLKRWRNFFLSYMQLSPLVTHHTLSWGWLSLAPERCQPPSPGRMCLLYTLNTIHTHTHAATTWIQVFK